MQGNRFQAAVAPQQGHRPQAARVMNTATGEAMGEASGAMSWSAILWIAGAAVLGCALFIDLLEAATGVYLGVTGVSAATGVATTLALTFRKAEKEALAAR